MNRLLTASDTAEILRMRKVVVLRMLSEGEIPAVRIGKTWKVDEEQLHEWFKKRASAEAERRKRGDKSEIQS